MARSLGDDGQENKWKKGDENEKQNGAGRFTSMYTEASNCSHMQEIV